MKGMNQMSKLYISRRMPLSELSDTLCNGDEDHIMWVLADIAMRSDPSDLQQEIDCIDADPAAVSKFYRDLADAIDAGIEQAAMEGISQMRAKKPSGGPAFPMPDATWGDFVTGSPVCGMTLRDWFAGQALPIYLAAADKHHTAQEVACGAYRMADAMIAERQRNIEEQKE
jgi:hypothetical protein